MLQKIILGILIVPALCFLALLALLPFLAWKELSISHRLIGLGFSAVCLLLGLFLWRLLVRKETVGSHGDVARLIARTPWGIALTPYEVLAFAVWIIVFVAAKWNAALGNDTRLLDDVLTVGELFITVMVGRRITKHLINRKKNAGG